MDGEDYVFSYTPSANGCFNINLSGTRTYTGVFVFSGCPGSAGFSCVKMATSTSGNPSLSGVPVTAGVTYYIVVDTWPTPTCTPFNISMTDCPPGATCASPKIIPSLPFQENNTTCGAGDDYGVFSTTPYGNCAPDFNDDGEDIVYAYTATKNQCINIAVTGWTYPGDGAFIVSRACPTAANSGCIAVSEGNGNTAPPAVNGIQVFAGTTIYITIDADDFDVPCMPFNIKVDTCATFIPQCGYSPPASDFCSSATPICDFTGYCGSTSPTYTVDQPSNINNVFCGSIENNSWVKFVAGSTTATFNIFFGNCTNGDGIQALVLEATNCANFVLKSNCYEPITASGSGVITATNLVVGNTYLIMVDGYAGDYCDYIIQAKSGVLLPVDAGQDVSICPGQSATLTASNGNNVYNWQPGGQTTKSITVSPTTTTDYVVNSASGNIGCPTPDQDTVRVTVVPTVVASLTSAVNANSCANTCDGSATIGITGGATPYTTSWTNGANTTSITGLCPGTTYTATVTDNLGCKDTAQVIMPPPVVANVNFTAPACGVSVVTLNTTATAGTGTFTYTGPGTLTFSSLGSGSFSATASAYGSYDITWTVTDGACSASITKTVNFRQTPVADFSFTAPACGSKTTSITTVASAGTGTFTFSGPGSLTFTSTGANTYNVSASNFGTYSVTWTVDNFGCTATITKSITFTAQPVAGINITGPGCNALTFTATTTSSVGSGSWTYTGPGVLTFTSTGANSYTANASTYGTYTVTWTITNGSCSATTSQSVTFDKQPAANAGTDQNICGLSTTFAATPSIGSAAWTQISGPAAATITSPNSATSTITTTAYGSYLFRWTEINGSCPASTDDMVIVFSQNPAGNAGPDQSVCGYASNLAGVASVGSGVWSGSGIANPTSTSTAVSTASAGSVTYTWTISNGSCPSISDQVIVNYSKVPTPNAGPDQSICGLSVTLNALPPTGSGSWIAPAAASFASTTNPKSTATVAAYGVYNFVWQESNSPCPLSNDTVKITFVQTPNPNAGADQNICGQLTNLNAATSPFTGNWTGPSGIVTPGSRTSAVNAPGYGSYTYVWTEFNAAPCPGKTDTVILTFSEQPIANAGPDKNICGNATNLAAVRSVSGSAGQWTGPAGVSYGNSTAPNTAVLVPSYGTYTFTWTETNGSICPPSADQVSITFVPPSNPNAGPDASVCGLNTSLGAIPSFGTGTWSYTGPGILSFTNINDPHSPIAANAYGKYRIAWTEGNSPCIANTDTVSITFNEPPTVDAGISPDKVCGLNYKLNAAASVGNTKWSWVAAAGTTGSISFKNGNDSTPQAEISASDFGQYFLIWKITNGACLPPADTVALGFFKKPTPDAGPDFEGCDTLKTQLSGITSVTGSWKWTGPTGGTISFSPDADRPNPIAEATVPGTYKLFFNELNDSICGVITDSLVVNFLAKPTANAGADASACGKNHVLGAQPASIGIGKWSFVSASDPSFVVSFADETLFNTQITLSATPPPSGVTANLRWSVNNLSCPVVSDDVSITFTEVPNSVDAGSDQVICDVLNTNLSANDFGGSGIWNIISSPNGATATLSNTTGTTANLISDTYGVYQVQRTVSVSGCPGGVVDVVNVDFRKMPNPAAGPDDTLCGSALNLAAALPGGRIKGVWTQVSGPAAAAFANDSSNSTGVDVGSGYGLYTFRWTESNLGCPDASDEVDILFQQQPTANAGLDASICGLSYDLKAVPSGAAAAGSYNGFWVPVSGPGTVTLNPLNGAKPDANAIVSDYGHYTLLWTEINGICPLSTDTVKVQFVNPSKPNAGPDKDICGLLDTLSAVPSFGLGEWINYNGNPGMVSFVNPLDPKTIIGVDTYGTYRFDWLEANSPCFANSDSVEITFHQQPVATAGFDADTCGLQYQLKASSSVSGKDYTGTWSGPLGTIFSNINDPHAVADVSSVGYGTHVFTWTEVNGAKCGASVDAVAITFVETPVADAGISPGKVCGLTVDLAANPSVGSGQWSGVGPDDFNFSIPTQAVTSGVADDYGFYTLYWKETNFGTHGGTCSSIDSIKVELYQQPSAYAGPDSAVCGNIITLTGVQSVPGSSITWSVVGNSGSASFSATDSVTTVVTANNVFGHIKLRFVENVGNGACISTDTTDVTFVQQPLANAGLPDSVCALTANLNAVPSAGNGVWKSITSGVVFSPDLSNPTVVISAPTYGIYQFVWSEDNGAPCPVSRDTVQLGFFKTPQPKAGLDFSVCGTVAKLNATPSAFAGQWSYTGTKSISFVDNTDPKTNVNLAAANSADYGLHSFTWTETNALCSAADQVAVFFSEMPLAQAGPDLDICGLNFTLNANPSVGNGQWTYNGPASDLSAFNGTNSATATGTASKFGTYSFNWIEKNPGICPADTDQVTLRFNEAPVAVAGPDSSVCSLSYVLKGKASVGTGTWTKVAGPGAASFIDKNNDTTRVDVTLQGVYQFAWSEANSVACPSSSDTVQIYFERAPQPQAGPDLNICGSSTNLKASPSIGNGQWIFIGDPATTVSFGNANSPTSSFSSNKFGAHPILWMETNTAVCGTRVDTVLVTLVEQPLANAGGPDYQICGTTLNLEAVPSVGVGQWIQLSGPDTGSFNEPFTATTLFSTKAGVYGTYTLRWNEDNGSPCVLSSDDITVSFHRQPLANAGLPQEICGLDASMQAVPSIGSGKWQLIPSGNQTASFGNQNLSNSTVTVNEYGDYMFVWTETNGNVCPPANDIAKITFKEAPQANAGPDQAICGLSATLASTNSSGSGYWSILSAPAALTLSDTNSNASLADASAHGNYLLSWTETNGKACPASIDTVELEFVAQPQANAGPDDRTCGLQFKLNALPSIGKGTWSSSDPNASFSPGAVEPNATVTVSSYGPHTFTWTEINKTPCTLSTDSVSIEFIEGPTASLSLSNDTVCSGDSAQLVIHLTGTGPFSVSFTTNGANPTTLNNVADGDIINVNPTVTSVYHIYNVVDGSGESCNSAISVPVKVVVNQRPTGLVAGNYQSCFGDSLSIPVQFTGLPPFEATFSNGVKQRFDGNGPYSYKFSTIDSIGMIAVSDKVCVGSAAPSMAKVTIHALPLGNLTQMGGNICEGQDAQLQFDMVTGKAPFSVYYTNASTAKQITIPGISYTSTESVAVGTTRFSIDSIRDANGCLGPGATIDIVVYPNPTYDISANTNICQGAAADVRFVFTPKGSGPWVVDYNPGSLSTTDLADSAIVQFSPSSSESYTFSKVTDKATGCSSLNTRKLDINVVPAPTLGASLDKKEMCAGDSAELTFHFNGIEPFEVSLNNGQTYTGLRNGDKVTVTSDTSINYTIVGFKDGSGLSCQGSLIVNVPLLVHPLPMVKFDVQKTSSCLPMIPVFVNNTDASMIGNGGCSWNFGDGAVSSDCSTTHAYNQSGVYNITLTVVSPQGCIGKLSQPTRININPDPVAKFSYVPVQPTVTSNKVEFSNESEGARTYNWNIAGTATTVTNPEHQFPTGDSGTYVVCLTAISDSGCVNISCQKIFVNGETSVFVPNAFTPDGDGINDEFKPSALGVDLATYEFTVFDRWGEVIFSSNDPKKGWDGNLQGSPVKSDVYPWRLIYKEKYSVERREQYGRVTLLR